MLCFFCSIFLSGNVKCNMMLFEKKEGVIVFSPTSSCLTNGVICLSDNREQETTVVYCHSVDIMSCHDLPVAVRNASVISVLCH